MSDGPSAFLSVVVPFFGVAIIVGAIDMCTQSNNMCTQSKKPKTIVVPYKTMTVQIDRKIDVQTSEHDSLIWGTPVQLTTISGKQLFQPVGPQEVFVNNQYSFQNKPDPFNPDGKIHVGGIYQLQVTDFPQDSPNSRRYIFQFERLDQPNKGGSTKTGAFITPVLDPQLIAAHRKRQHVATRA